MRRIPDRLTTANADLYPVFRNGVGGNRKPHLAAFAGPQVDTLKGSRHANMKELRFDADQGVWRIAFAFDPERFKPAENYDHPDCQWEQPLFHLCAYRESDSGLGNANAASYH